MFEINRSNEILQDSVYSSFQGSNMLHTTEVLKNDPTLFYPPRISVEVKWTEALTSKWVSFLPFSTPHVEFAPCQLINLILLLCSSNCRLKILNARLSDSGNYSCMPTLAESTSVMVHILNGEYIYVYPFIFIQQPDTAIIYASLRTYICMFIYPWDTLLWYHIQRFYLFPN